MKKFTLFLFLGLFALPKTNAQLNGSYTIGTGGDYATIADAVAALKTQGINGPVTFSIKTGTYNEQVTLGKIPGQGFSNRIIFDSQTGNAADVTVYFASTSTADNYILRYDSATHVTFQNITFNNTGTSYTRNIELKTGVPATGIRFYNNIFNAGTASSSSNKATIYTSGAAIDSCIFQGNTFNGGHSGIFLDGPASPLTKGVQISGNIFNNQYYSIYLKEMDAPVISGNTLINPTNRGIFIEYCDNQTLLTFNKVTSTLNIEGIYVNQCDGTIGTRALIANNFVQVGSTSNSVGMQINTCTYQNVYHNSVNITGTTTGNSALQVTSGSNIQVKNNIFSCEYSGYVLYTNSATAISSSDYNNFYSRSNYMFYRVSTNYRDLNEYETASTQETNSLSVYPGFVSSSNLHAKSSWLDNSGITLAEVTTDYDGDLRNNPPDIGADEYTSYVNSPLSGSYTLGSGGDFPSFNAAIDTLKLRGISSTVTFNVLNGSYYESLNLVEIPGVTFQDSIVFQSQSGNPANVTIDYSASGSADNHVILFSGADRISFKDITLTASGVSGYNRVAEFYGFARKNNFLNCVINGGSNSSNTNYAHLYSGGAYMDSTLISGCTVNNGYGFYLFGPSITELATGVSILNNTFIGAYNSVYLEKMSAPKINYNIIQNTTYDGIHLQYCDNDLQVISNKISSTSDKSGIYLINCDGISAKKGLIANNFIAFGNTGTSYGIYLNTSTYQNIFHNSVTITSTGLNSSAFYAFNGANLQLKNTILANTGSGYALYTNSATNLSATDYNNLFTNGNYVAYWGLSSYSNLPALSATSGKDVNSVSVNPKFFSSSDLHTNTYWLDGKGTPVAEVTSDIDDELRDTGTPDIGADEYTSSLIPMSGSYTIGTTGDFPTFSNAVDSLNFKGVSNAVIFNVLNGTYYEQLVLTAVPGASAVNTITFQSQSGNPADVTLDFTALGSGDNYVININGADYMVLKNMTITASNTSGYAVVIRITGNSEYNTITGNLLNGKSTSTIIYAYQSSNHFTSIDNNTFNSGYNGIYMEGISSSVPTNSVSITGNTFNSPSYDGIHLKYHDAPFISGNNIINEGQYGINLDYCYNDFEILSNNISSSSDNVGIYISYCNSTSSLRGLVANNFVTMGNTGSGNCLYIYSSNYVNAYHNSLLMKSTGTSSKALYVNAGTFINLVNNNVSANGGGYAYYNATSSSISTSDYNNFYSRGNILSAWNNTDQKNLAALKTASGKETNSLSVYPGYLSATDLHINSYWLDGKGTALASVITDYDGEARNGATPDIGADEYTSTLTPMSGIYTIGTTGNYPTFVNAIDTLNARGVSGPVTFNVLNGTYNEQFVLSPVSNASSTNTITFQSQSGLASSVTVDYNATTSAANYVAHLSGASFIILQNLTMTASSTSGNSVVIFITGNATNNQIKNCVINGKTASSAIRAWTSLCENLLISGNTINSGFHSIYIEGINTITLTSGANVTLNTINAPAYNGIYLQNQNAPSVTSNEVNNTGQDGIRMEYCDNAHQVLKNRIYSVNDNSGILLSYCDGTTSTRGLVANNFVMYGNNGNANGIYTFYSTYQNIFHNSINITTGSFGSGSASFKGYYGSNINVVNNILTNDGPGYSYSVNNSTVAGTSDFNAHSTKGNYLAYWGANVKDLTELKSVSAKEASSVSAAGDFVSATDLHVSSYWLDNAGTPLTDVTDDIDGEIRNGGTPDIGADEFVSPSLPLAGTYIIGTGGNFSTFNEAIDSLNLLGVSDTVIFLIKPGTYYEQFEIMQIAGADSIHKIRFESQTGNSSDVVLNFSSTSASDNFIVKLSNSDFITFRNLTFTASGISGYANAIYISGDANNISFEQCIFNGATGVNSTSVSLIQVDNSSPEFLTLKGNTFNNGGYGLLFYGISSVNPGKNIYLLNNTFNYQYYPVYIYYCSDVFVKSNILNEIKLDGLYLNYCSGEIILSGNKIYGNNDNTGINLNNTNGTAQTPVLIANNFVSNGISGNSNGIYMYLCNYINVFHNTVLQRSSSSSSTAFYAYSGSNINVLNNIFAAFGSGFPYFANSGTNISNSNYNNLYSNGSYLAFWAVNYVNLAALQSGSSKDANSLSVYPAFVSQSNLHLKSLGLNNKGIYLADVPNDIDGEVRDTLAPDMGADEYDVTTSALAGIYTIGVTGNFASLAQAIDSLMTLGVSDSVIFQFQTGIYNEKAEINSISGATSLKKIVFEAQSGNPADVLLFNSATSDADNYLFSLKNAKYLTFRKMTLKATGASYASIFTLSGETGNITISDCILEGKLSGSGYFNALIRSSQTVIDSISILSNKLTNGGYGVYLYGLSPSNLISGIKISGNELTGFYYGIYLNYCDASLIEKNKILSTLDRSIYAESCTNGLQINQNILNSNNANYGIYMYLTNGTPGANGMITNNAIYMGSNNVVRGIYIENSSYQNIYHNSIHITGASTGSVALQVFSGNNINVINNILANSGTGYAYYVNTTTAIQNSDFNNLLAAGTKVGYWGADQTNLAAFKTASGKETNSVSVNPLFESKTDLHASAVEIYEKGTPLVTVTNDMDGELRDAVKPDIGADEIICTNPVVSLIADTVCNGDTSLILNISTGLRTWSTFKWDILDDGNIDFTAKDSISYKFDTSGNFPVKLIITNPIGCVDSLTGSVPVVSPAADAGLSTAVCRGSKIQLKASKGTFYSWWPSEGLSDTTVSNPYASPVNTTTYYVEVTENSGCISVDSVTVFVKPVPVANAGPDTTIAFGDSVSISAAPGGETYAWDNGMTGMNITVQPSFTRTFTLFVTKNGCGAKDEITVFVDGSPLPSFSFTNKLFGILPEGPLGPDNCPGNASLGLSTKDPDTGDQIYGQCSNQVSTAYSGVAPERFRMIFGDQSLTYLENIDANRQKMIYTKGTASLQMDNTGSGTWENILILKNVSTLLEFICPDTLRGRMRGEILGGDPLFYSEYTSTGNNQILAEFTSIAIDSVHTDSLGNKTYTVYDYTFELLPVERPVYVKGLGIVAPGDILSFPNTGVSLDFNAYIASSDSASATVVYYPYDPPYTQAQDTIATVFNNEFWELGSTLDAFQVKVCFDYDTAKLNTSDIQYLNLVYQEYIGGPWTVVSGTPEISGDKICVVTEHFSNWSLGITKPDARIKIDTIFSNSGTASEYVYKEFENEVNLGMKLAPGQNQDVQFKAYTLNPGGDLPQGVKKFSDTYWELHADSDIETILEFNPASLAGYDSITDDGKYTILYRPDAVTDWSAIPTSRVRRGMKEVLIIKQNILVSTSRERNYVLGNVDTVLELFSSSAGVTIVCEGGASQFTAMVSGGIAPFTFSWMGDDGFNSALMNPDYIFPSGAGNYNFTLLITDANGAETTVSGVATVNPLPQILVSNDTTICKGESVTLTAGGAQDYFWNSGDSTASILVSPLSSFAYIVTGTDVSGCSSDAVIAVTVNTETADFSMPDTALINEMVSFINSGTGGTEWHWDFGDGNVSAEQNPQHGYSSIGVYPVCLTVDGCDSVCKNIAIKLLISIDKELRKRGYAVFPNPADKKLNVIFNSRDFPNTSVTLSDIYGKIIYRELTLNRKDIQQIQIDLPESVTGIYFLKIQSDKGTNIEKVVIR